MQIPPLSSSGNLQGGAGDPIVKEFNQLWDDWYDNPTKQTGKALLQFIEKHQKYFEKLAKNTPQPHPNVSIANACRTAEEYLRGWIHNGCDPNKTTPSSEFIRDIALWIDYANK